MDVIHTNRKSILKVGNIFENASRESIRNNAEIITIFQIVEGRECSGDRENMSENRHVRKKYQWSRIGYPA